MFVLVAVMEMFGIDFSVSIISGLDSCGLLHIYLVAADSSLLEIYKILQVSFYNLFR